MSSAVAGMRGSDISGFRWVRPLGQGDLADVFLYRQELSSRDVAIEVVRIQGGARGTKELHREADTTTLLSGHPSVMELYGVGTTAGGRTYLAMEYCPVTDLPTQARARSMLLENALDTMIKICGVAEIFYWQGYVHRDIKSSSIMMDAYDKPVPADFGVTSKVEALEVSTFDDLSVLRTSPEQQDMTAPILPLQSVWALVSATWTFVTGYSPLEDLISDNSAALIANHVQRGRMRGLRRADAPCELERVLCVAMVVDPTERIPPAKEFGENFQRVQEETDYPRMEMEIKERCFKASVTVISDQKTRLCGAPAIDPDAVRLRSTIYSFEGRAGSGGVEAVVDSRGSDRSGDVNEVSARHVVEGSSEAKKTISSLAGVLLVLLAALIAAGLMAGIPRGQGSFTQTVPGPEKTSTSTAPGNALGVAPPKVSDPAGEYSGDTVAWMWIAPEGPAPLNVVYAYEGSGTVGKSRGRVESTSVTIDEANDENCIEIITVSRSFECTSDPVRIYMEVP